MYAFDLPLLLDSTIIITKFKKNLSSIYSNGSDFVLANSFTPRWYEAKESGGLGVVGSGGGFRASSTVSVPFPSYITWEGLTRRSYTRVSSLAGSMACDYEQRFGGSIVVLKRF